MVETIQAFVDKIRTEGVQAGQQQADDLLVDAKKQADEIVSQANEEKEKILSGAKAEAESILSRSQTELKLASRDAVMRLRDALAQVLRQVLAAGAKEKLDDTEFVGQALHEIVTQYGKADIKGKRTFRINVPKEMRQKLTDWAMKHISQKTPDGTHISFDLKGTLSQAGFEYNATGATVEVTLESVVETLSEMVSPKLREIIEQAQKEE